MINKTFEEKLFDILKKNPDFLDQESGLLVDRVIDSAYKADRKLIELLLENAEIKKKFFSEIQKHWVFNISDFVMFVQDKHFLNDSYTQYKNKIGLTIDGKFLNERKEVALVWPFKDTVLEGGMTKEDQKKKEIFFNEILAQDEIDKLFAPKVLTNWKRYTIKGEEEVKELKRDQNGTIKENFLIKGNNLLALYALKEQFRGKVKLIYIDPPYNTGSDSFGYNDNFNHSTWLTFMKNRLEVARILLAEDGFLYIQIDENEQPYLRILCDEIFGRENFRNSIIWKRSQNISSISNIFKNSHDVILFYAKSQNSILNRLYKENDENYLKQYSHKDEKGQYRHAPILVSGKRTGSTGSVWRGFDPNQFGRNGMHWVTTIEKLEKLDKEGKIYWPKNGGQPMLKFYLEESKGVQVSDIWDDIKLISPTSIESMSFSGQKPEELLQRIIESVTKENEIVLDYHSGTGTTLAVAHKMNRQYIGIEQMNYIHDLPESRLKQVIKGDESGISKSVNWKGGGDFVYCELMKYNESFVEEIENAKDIKAILKVWEQMKEKAFFRHNFEMQEFEKNIEEFKKLGLEKQKQILFCVLDKNQLYVNYSEIEDKKFSVEKNDKEINKEFYEC